MPSKALLHELGESISFGRLSLKAKVLWPMLLASSDDQGRGLAESDAIKWRVCPNVDEIVTDEIPELLAEMIEQGMVHIYQDDRDRRLYQVIRWWKFQQHTWARPSRFAAPEDWVDRVRYQAKGGDHVKANWDHPGGFVDSAEVPAPDLPGDLPSPLPSDLPDQPDGLQQNLTKQNLTKQNLIQHQHHQTEARASPATAGDGGDPSEDADDVVNSKEDVQANLERLNRVGVHRSAALSLASLDPEHVLGWTRYAEKAKGLTNPAGLVVAKLQAREPPPPPDDEGDWRRFVEGEYADYVEH